MALSSSLALPFLCWVSSKMVESCNNAGTSEALTSGAAIQGRSQSQWLLVAVTIKLAFVSGRGSLGMFLGWLLWEINSSNG